jgi:hypothetical protein
MAARRRSRKAGPSRTGLVGFSFVGRPLLVLGGDDGAGMLGKVGEQAHDTGASARRAIVDGAEFEVDERVVERGNAAAVELIAEPVPGLLGGGVQFAPVEKDMALVGVQIEGEAVVGRSAARRRYSRPVSESRKARMAEVVR